MLGLLNEGHMLLLLLFDSFVEGGRVLILNVDLLEYLVQLDFDVELCFTDPTDFAELLGHTLIHLWVGELFIDAVLAALLHAESAQVLFHFGGKGFFAAEARAVVGVFGDFNLFPFCYVFGNLRYFGLRKSENRVIL